MCVRPLRASSLGLAWIRHGLASLALERMLSTRSVEAGTVPKITVVDVVYRVVGAKNMHERSCSISNRAIDSISGEARFVRPTGFRQNNYHALFILHTVPT